jgi:RNA polymerase sigma factor (sigma-70 family)
MAERSPFSSLLRRLRRSLEVEAGDTLTDAELLQRWLEQRDQAAFEALVWRLGPLVLGVCRRLLYRTEELEDAFQATFLVLVRKAATIQRHSSLSGWLYQVAYRVSLRLRAGTNRRQQQEQPAIEEPAVPDSDDLLWRDLRPVLDQEIGRLPDRYRITFILCYLQGKTNAEAARELGCPMGTVLSRLAWARERLRDRLSRRGVTLTVAGLVGLLGRSVAEATPVRRAVSAATQLSEGAVPAGVASLAKGVIQTMALIRLKSVAAVVCSLALLGVAGGLYYQAQARGPEEAAGGFPFLAAAPAAPLTKKIDVPSPRDGILVLMGTEVKEGEKVPPAQLIKVKVGNEEKAYRRLRVGDQAKEGQLLARLDDRLARAEVEIRSSKVEAAEAEHRASEKTREEAKKRFDGIQATIRAVPSAISKDEQRAVELTWQRYIEEEKAKEAGVRQAKHELEIAQTQLSMHEVRSPVTGVIRTIYKHRGEAVKALEPVFQIEFEEEP